MRAMVQEIPITRVGSLKSVYQYLSLLSANRVVHCSGF